MQAVRHAVHARASGWRADGVVGGLVRGLFQIRASQGRRRWRGGAGMTMVTAAPATARIADPVVRFTEAQIDMAHGAGGTASRRLIEGLFVPLLVESHGPLGDAARINMNGVAFAMTTDSFVVRPLRFPGGSI